MKSLLRKYFRGFFPIEKITTDYNYLEVNKRHGHFVLDSQHVNYSFGMLHNVFQKAFQQTNTKVSPFQNALILGFGAGSVAYILQKELDFKGTITGVELDPQVIKLAEKYFSLNSLQNLKIEIDDAYSFIFKENKKYDLIVVDLFIDHFIPEKFDKKEFLVQLEKLLEKRGLLLYNRMNQSFKDKNRIKSFRKKWAEVFQTAEVTEEFSINSKNIIFHVKK